MSKGITVSLYLVDGEPSGIVCAYLSNWTGQGIKIPRNLLEKAGERDEVNGMGIYMLFGTSEENPDEQIVYVGEADNIYKRLIQHIKDDTKLFWNEAIVFTSKDDFLTKGHIKYLEYELIQYAKSNPAISVHNKNNATKSALPEMAISDMVAFIENIKIVMPTLGFSIFKDTKIIDENNSLYFLEQSGIKAKGRVTSNGFLVIYGSELVATTKDSLSNGYRNRRDLLISKGIVVNINGKLSFVKEYEFSSPSAAADIILGSSVNGRIAWKDSNGVTLKAKEEITLSNSVKQSSADNNL